MSAPAQRLTLEDLVSSVEAVVSTENDFIANMANVSALIFEALSDVNWAGFYILRGQELVLGPFQGRMACTRIPVGRGVCGVAAEQRVTQRVDDVHAFPGHIACDAASASEIVVPLFSDGVLIGVLDIDSPVKARFGVDEQVIVEQVAALVGQCYRVR
ncbi:GAF domain-containing protein [Neokomagataea anthophila]|uniref:GAF domain-containing protein n=1 Tax=Neokomagataea anthophila TaxID=2826925 RepID=A0ABS5E8M4_9PROT|nr:GAF domain-containing protein [Neokomagataea anthophila]MBR0560260.1 GAF domain-containing protein [Neokomagataea anthophila]